MGDFRSKAPRIFFQSNGVKNCKIEKTLKHYIATVLKRKYIQTLLKYNGQTYRYHFKANFSAICFRK